jgi:hypothetical protein
MFQVYALLSPKTAHHIVWNRFAKRKHSLGGNIPLDLALEFLNRIFVSANSIQRRAYIIEPIHDNLSQSTISLHRLFTSCPHLTCERALFGLVIREYSLPFSHFGFENILIWLSCFRHSTCDIILLSINMGT